MIRFLLPNTPLLGSFIATNAGITTHETEVRPQNYLVIIVHESKKGYKGFRINKMYQNNPDQYIYEGGNYELGEEFYILHTKDFHESKTKLLNDFISYTSIPNKNYLNQVKELPKQYLLITGYIFWPKNKLEEEIINSIWIGMEYEHDILFNTPIVNKWNRAYQKSGVIPERMNMFNLLA